MTDDPERRQIIDRANRMLKQSKRLRKLADELQSESDDIRRSTKRPKAKQRKRR